MRSACFVVAGALAAMVVAVEARPNLSGKWTLDEKSTHEDQRNWRRPVADELDSLVGSVPSPWTSGYIGGPLSPGPGMPMGSAGPRSSAGLSDNDVRRAMRDLLEQAASYVIDAGDGHVTITDDLNRTTTFAADGQKEKHRQGATDYESQTSWNADGQLVQELAWSKELRVTEIWMPGDDGQSLFVWIKVTKPTFIPPVKDIKRVYARVQ